MFSRDFKLVLCFKQVHQIILKLVFLGLLWCWLYPLFRNQRDLGRLGILHTSYYLHWNHFSSRSFRPLILVNFFLFRQIWLELSYLFLDLVKFLISDLFCLAFAFCLLKFRVQRVEDFYVTLWLISWHISLVLTVDLAVNSRHLRPHQLWKEWFRCPFFFKSWISGCRCHDRACLSRSNKIEVLVKLFPVDLLVLSLWRVISLLLLRHSFVSLDVFLVLLHLLLLEKLPLVLSFLFMFEFHLSLQLLHRIPDRSVLY